MTSRASPSSVALRTAGLTALAMVAFAANSILCRAALGGGMIDAASFSTLRLVSGAIALLLLHSMRAKPGAMLAGSWASATLLFLYAVPFSFAYNSLTTGTGALILFGAVQATMLISALVSGERPHVVQWAGLLLALGGLIYMVLPGVDAPPPFGSALMAIAGIAWGLYSLRGRSATDPLGETAANFLRSVPMVLAVSLFALTSVQITPTGALLAVASGTLASGVGYAIWYAALGGLTATLGSTVQLSVPVIAALGGVLFMAEAVTTRLMIASVLILGGVMLSVLSPKSRGVG
jgi:drug/metabolite transporter (DMT)-like permease